MLNVIYCYVVDIFCVRMMSEQLKSSFLNCSSQHANHHHSMRTTEICCSGVFIMSVLLEPTWNIFRRFTVLAVEVLLLMVLCIVACVILSAILSVKRFDERTAETELLCFIVDIH